LLKRRTFFRVRGGLGTVLQNVREDLWIKGVPKRR